MTGELKRILFVEDEEEIREVAKMALEAVGGFELVACASGAEAIAAAPAANADLLLLDVMMPGMDGPATLEALRHIPATAQTPVIFMTAKVQPAEIAYFRSLGAIEVIAKPFDPTQLSRMVLDAWKHAHG